MSDYTKAERAAIVRAYDALEYAASHSWSDAPRLAEALKLERKQAAPSQSSPSVWARARVLKCWHWGYMAPDTPAREVADWRPGALGAFMLGANMADRFAETDDARGRSTRKAAELCPDAIAAYESQSARQLAAI